MKRVLIAVAGVGIVVAAIGVARGHTGETWAPDAHAPSSPAPSQRGDITRQIDQQAKQAERARQEIREKTQEQAEILRQRQEKEDLAR